MTARIKPPLLQSTLQSCIQKALQQSMPSMSEGRAASDSGMQKHNEGYDQPFSDASCTSDFKPLRRQLYRRTLQHCSSKTTRSVFGSIYVRSRTYRICSSDSEDSNNTSIEDKYEFATAFVLHPSWWLVKCGISAIIRATISSSIQGWTYDLRPSRAVPDDALIFEFCDRGNIDGVRSLLQRKQASPWDTASDGWTPLHVCTEFVHRLPYHFHHPLVLLFEPRTPLPEMV